MPIVIEENNLILGKNMYLLQNILEYGEVCNTTKPHSSSQVCVKTERTEYEVLHTEHLY